jgi:hypothetical protein
VFKPLHHFRFTQEVNLLLQRRTHFQSFNGHSNLLGRKCNGNEYFSD